MFELNCNVDGPSFKLVLYGPCSMTRSLVTTAHLNGDVDFHAEVIYLGMSPSVV